MAGDSFDATTDTPRPRGRTPNEVARLLRVRPGRVRTWIKAGELQAVNTVDPGSRPRFVVLPEQLDAFLARRQAEPAPTPPRRKRPRRPPGWVDYF